MTLRALAVMEFHITEATPAGAEATPASAAAARAGDSEASAGKRKRSKQAPRGTRQRATEAALRDGASGEGG